MLHIAGDADFRMRISRFALVALQSAICAFKAGSRYVLKLLLVAAYMRMYARGHIVCHLRLESQVQVLFKVKPYHQMMGMSLCSACPFWMLQIKGTARFVREPIPCGLAAACIINHSSHGWQMHDPCMRGFQVVVQQLPQSL